MKKNLLSNLYNEYEGKSVLVLGCGESAKYCNRLYDYDYIFGVNYIMKHGINPDFLLIVDPKVDHFDKEILSYIKQATPQLFFSHLPDWDEFINYKTKVEYSLGTLDLKNFGNKNGIVDHSMTSPYMAVLISYYLGFSQIDVGGVDFITHSDLNKYRDIISRDFYNLKKVIEHYSNNNCIITNLSPYFKWEKFK